MGFGKGRDPWEEDSQMHDECVSHLTGPVRCLRLGEEMEFVDLSVYSGEEANLSRAL